LRLFNYIAGRLWSSSRTDADSARERKISAPVVKIAVGSIGLGMAVMILTVSIVTGFKDEVSSRATGFAGHIIVSAYTNNNSFEQEPVSTNASFLQLLQNDPAIKHLQFFATKNAIIKTAYENQGIILKGVTKNYDWKFVSGYLQEGTVPVFEDSVSSDKILVSKTIADKLNIHAGDKLVTYFVNRRTDSDSARNQFEQRVRKFVVSGIYQTGFADVDDNIVFADLRQIQRLNYWNTDQADGIEIELKDPARMDEMAEKIDEEVGQGLEARTVKAIYPTLFSWLDLLNSNAVIIISLMVIVAIMNMISALLILILERSNTIGVLKAIGAGNGLVQNVFLYQAGRMLLKGLLIGNAAGIILCLLQLKFRLVSLDPGSYYVSYVPIEMKLLHVLGLNVLTMACCLLMMFLPVLVISKISPVKTLRFK
jgi:lipoprotein-releasing system permease protein